METTCPYREAARSAGQKTYNTGIPCKHQHVSGWSTKTGACLACGREARKRYVARGKPQHPAREAARKANQQLYFTGKPCKAGHVSSRFVSNGTCTTCLANYGVAYHADKHANDPTYVERRNKSAKQWKTENKARVRETQKAWALRNPEKIAAYMRKNYCANKPARAAYAAAWRAAHPGETTRKVKEWAAKNPERFKAGCVASKHNYRTAKKQAGGRCTGADIKALFDLHKGKCAECGRKAKLVIDHIKPVSKGGTSNKNNLQLLCAPCNRAKWDRDPITWAQSKGRLL